MDLRDKKVLVTGGSEGLGFAITKKLLEKGALVYICGRDYGKLEKAKESLSSEKVNTIQCDVSDFESVQKMAEEIGDVDILINNAGVMIDGELGNNSYEDIDKAIDTNFKGVVFVTRAFLPGIIKKGNGFILNISSTSGAKPKYKQSVYAGTKFAVRGFTDSLKLDFEGTNIKVAGFYPGGMKTKLFEKGNSIVDTSHFMDPDKVAEVVIFVLERDDTMILDNVVLSKRILEK